MEPETQLLDRIDEVGPFLSRAGRYHTTTAHQAYSVLKTLSWHPWVKLGEELYFPEGSILFAEIDPISTLTPNVEKVGWGTTDDYYERRLRDYDNWEVAFWREIIQNSRDSGATRIDLECVEDVYEDPETHDRIECMRVSATDNGTGMDYETLMTAFFRRGGTLKREGSVGGFGDAKNLILTPWLGYEVRTRDVVARGRHEDLFADLTKQGEPYLDGTKVTVWMPMTRTTTPEHAQFLVEQSSLEGIRFSVNGAAVREGLPRGRVIEEKSISVAGSEVGQLVVYHSPRAKRSGIYVRSHGLYMYEMHGYEGDFKGVVTVEVNAPPIDVFTTKRDALSYNSTARADVQDVLKRLTTDPRQALKAVRDKKMQIYRGTGAIQTEEGKIAEMAAEIASKADLQTQRKGTKPIKIDKQTAQRLSDDFSEKVQQLKEALGYGPGPIEEGVELAPLPSTFQTLVSQSDFFDVEQISGAIQVSMWKPDFFLYQNISPWHMPKKLHPESLQNKYHVLLRVWTEICKFVLVQLGIFRPYGVGWCFDSEWDPKEGGESVVAAMWVKHEGMDWLLLNPVNIERRGYGDNVSFEMTSDRFKLSNPRDVEELVALAVHEVTHMQGYTGHTDAYASAITENMKAVFRIAPVLKQIVKEARGAVREVRASVKERRTSRRPEQRPSAPKPSGVVWEDEGDFVYGNDRSSPQGDVVSVKRLSGGMHEPRLWSSVRQTWEPISGMPFATMESAKASVLQAYELLRSPSTELQWEEDGTWGYDPNSQRTVARIFHLEHADLPYEVQVFYAPDASMRRVGEAATLKNAQQLAREWYTIWLYRFGHDR